MQLSQLELRELENADFTCAVFSFPDGHNEAINSKTDKAAVHSQIAEILSRGGRHLGYIAITWHPGEGRGDVIVMPNDERLKRVADELIRSVNEGGIEPMLGDGASRTIQ